MRGYVLTRHGGPEALAYREDLPEPAPGPGEVLVRVGAAGLNNTDIWTREGAYGGEDDPSAASGWRRGEPFVFPRIQGADVAGEIAAVGDGVPGTRRGERVLVNPVLYAGEGDGLFDARLLGSEVDGGFAEFCVVPADNAVTVDSDLSDAELATFPTAYLTAEHMLNRARAASGEAVLVTGASGGVGSALLQLAADRGARPIAVVGAGKEQPARDLGAGHVFTRGDRLAARVEQASGEQPVDVVADLVGGGQFGELLQLLRPGGRYVTAGAIAGPLVGLDLRTLYLKHLELIGSTVGTREEFRSLVERIEAGRIRPLLAGRYALAELPQAQAAFVAKGFFGKLVVVP